MSTTTTTTTTDTTQKATETTETPKMATVKASNGVAYDQVLVDIVEYVYHYKVEVPGAWKQARVALLDALGCAVETLKTNTECVKMIGPVVPGTKVPNGFKLPGTGFQLDPVKGAFDLGAMIRYLDHNDAFPGVEWGHPSDNLGALLAVSDWLSRSGGEGGDAGTGPKMNLKNLMLAMIKAYEIQGTFQIGNAFNAVGLDHTILVKIASTVCVSWLLGLSESEALAALSQAWQDGPPLRTFRQGTNTGPRKGWAGGDACMRAVHLALLTKAGQPGAPTVLTAPKFGFYDAMFGGKQFHFRRPYYSRVMENIFFKLIPAEGHGISGVEAAVRIAEDLRTRGVNPAQDIASIALRGNEACCKIIDKQGPLRNAADRDHCLQYMVAVVLLKGSVIDGADYRDDSPYATDPAVASLREKTTLVEDPQFTADYHDMKRRTNACGVKITLKDGTEIPEVMVEHPLGHPWREDTPDAVRAKFRSNMRMAYDDQEIDAILEASGKDDMPVSEFVDLLAR